MLPVLQVWSAPKCQTGAVPIASLPVTTAAQITETITGTDDGGTVTLPADVARACGVEEGRILRAVFPLRGVVEWVIVRVQDADPAALTSVTLGPLRQLLALRGTVRELSETGVTVAFTPDPLTVSDFLTRYVLTNLAADGLAWLSAGTIEYTGTIAPATWTAARRGELLTTIEQLTGYEVALRRLANDTGYAIDVLARRNTSAETVLFEIPATAQSLTRARDLLQTATQVRPTGDDSAPMGEVDWVGGAATGSGPFWIPLSDPNGGAAPIHEDDQFVGAYLGLQGGGALMITDSRASDSAVQVSTLGAYATGQKVVLWENTTGRPVSTITSPSALASSKGLVEAQVTVRGARAERTLNRNGDFLSGGTYWTDGAQGEPIARTDFGKALTFAANGLRAAATGTGTPFAVDGLPASEIIYQGDQLVIEGVTYTVTADAVPNTSGGLTLLVTPVLAATYADDTLITIVRRERRVWQKNGTLLYADYLTNGGLLAMKDVASDGLLFRPMAGLSLVHDDSGLSFTGNVTAITYDSGYAGAFTVDTSGATGTAPTQFDDNDTFTAVFTRETRGFRFSGSQTAGASSVVLKNVTALARRDWTTADTVFVRRDLSATALITAMTQTGPKTFDATITLGSSTLDDIATADRDGLAVIGVGGSWEVAYGGDRVYPAVLLFTVSGISGSTMSLSVFDAGATSVEAASPSLPTTSTATWAIVDNYPVTSTASWGNNGRATVAITVPSGRTIARGTPIYANWVGGGSAGAEAMSATPMFAHATVAGAASALEIAGWDDYRSDWDGTSTLTTAVYRMFGGTSASSWSFPGETLVAAATATANGSGQASVTLTAANATTIADNTVVTLTRPAMIPAGERTTGSAMRVFAASGSLNPAPSTAAVVSETAWIAVPSGGSRQVTFVGRATINAGTYGAGGFAPQLALVNTSTNVTVGAVTVDATLEPTAVTLVPLSLTATITTSGLYQLRLYGGGTSNYGAWVVFLDAAFYVGDTVLPYFPGSRSRLAFNRGQVVLAQRKSSARYRVTGIDQAALAGVGAPLVPGQSARLRAPALGLDTTQRIVRLVWAWPDGVLVDVECEAIQPRFTDVTVSL